MPNVRERRRPGIANALASRLRRDKELILEHQKDFDARKKAFTKADVTELSAAIRQEKKLYDALVRGGKPKIDPDRVGRTTRAVIRSQMLKTVPAVRKLVRFNAANVRHLESLLHGSKGDVFDSDLITLPEAAIGDALEYQAFEAPYHFSEVHEPDGSFEYDGSYAIHRWGVFGNDIHFVHDHDHGDLDLSFSSSLKYAYTSAGVGMNYVMPAQGSLDVTLVVQSLSSEVTFDIDDYVGSSESLFDFENMFFVSLSIPTPGLRHSAYVIDETIYSDGDAKSGALSTLQPGQRFVLTFRTEDLFEQNTNVEILLTSFVRVWSSAFLMRNSVRATLNWHLEKVLLKVT
jgi:hypothetical protein